MKNRSLIILAGNANFTVWKRADGAWHALAGAQPYDDSGYAFLAGLAQSHARAVWRILLDQVEEEFQLEVLPALGRSDTKALLARKLEQQFRGTPYRIATPVKRRQADKSAGFLLSALTRREVLDQLLAILLDARCVLAGIHSLAMLLQVWQKKLAASHPHSLLLGEFVPGQVRQTYCQHEGLLFSRQALLVQKGHADELANEIRRTRQYLTTLRQMARDDVLEVLLLCDPWMGPADEAALRTALQGDAAQIRLHLVQPLVLDAHAKQESDWLQAALTLLASGGVPNQYATPGMLRFLRLQQVNSALFILGGSVLLGALLASASLLSGLSEREADYALAQRTLMQTLKEKQRVDGLLATQPNLDPLWVRDVTVLAERSLSSWPDPEAAAKATSRVLLEFPSLQIDRFEWWQGRAPENAAIEEGSGSSADTPAQSGTTGGETGQAEYAPGAEYFILAGALRAQAGEYRQAMQQFEQLMARTRQFRHVTVEAIKWPIDVSSAGHLGGESKQTDPEQREFVLLVRRIAPGQGAPQ